MGWMYYILLEKDVFVSKVSSSRLRDSEVYFALWYNDEMHKWMESNLEHFRPPREKH